MYCKAKLFFGILFMFWAVSLSTYNLSTLGLSIYHQLVHYEFNKYK